MNRLLLIFLFTCATLSSVAQVNFVKNPSFEEMVSCPGNWNQVAHSKYWTCAVDTVGAPVIAPEFFNVCAGSNIYAGVPENTGGYQYPRTGDGYLAAILYYDQTAPAPGGISANWRDYFQGHLHTPLVAGKTYCVSYWVCLAEMSGYAQKEIGAYLDNGDINKHSPAGDAITDVIPQVYSTIIIKDTQNWVKVEGSFIANGNETHITIGNFAKQADVDTESVPYYTLYNQYSYYLFDDISVIPIDLNADAGKDAWVEQGKIVKIGRVRDSTAEGLDCKWYYKGTLIDSGAIISVNASASVGVVDTYSVVQTICGVVKSDTVLVLTVSTGIKGFDLQHSFIVYPNPSNGSITIVSPTKENETKIVGIYDMLGRVLYTQSLVFQDNHTNLNVSAEPGTYFLELQDVDGNSQRQRIVIR